MSPDPVLSQPLNSQCIEEHWACYQEELEACRSRLHARYPVALYGLVLSDATPRAGHPGEVCFTSLRYRFPSAAPGRPAFPCPAPPALYHRVAFNPMCERLGV